MRHLLLPAALLVLLFTPGSGAEYDIYLLAGQSNMDGRGKVKNLPKTQQHPSDKALIYYRNPPHSTNGWKPLAPGYSIPPRHKDGLPSPTFGPEIGFEAAMVEAQPTRRFALIKGSKRGTSLRKDWQPGEKGKPDTQGSCYRSFIETINLATKSLTEQGHQYKLRGLLWH